MRILDLLKTKNEDEDGLSFERKRAIKLQYKTLRKLVSKGAITDYGKRNNFSSVLASEDFYESFNSQVPVTNYEKLYPWWQRAYNGEHDVCWPGKVDYFALSSGTSEGASKYIPVTNDMLKFKDTKITLTELAYALEEVVVKPYLLTGFLEIDAKNISMNDSYQYAISGLSSGYEAGNKNPSAVTKVLGAILNPADLLRNLFGKKPAQMRKLRQIKEDDRIRVI